MDVLLPPLHPGQRSIAEHAARFRVMQPQAPLGKTRLGAALCGGGLHRGRACGGAIVQNGGKLGGAWCGSSGSRCQGRRSSRRTRWCYCQAAARCRSVCG